MLDLVTVTLEDDEVLKEQSWTKKEMKGKFLRKKRKM